jgi:hypothetical protein
VAKNAKGLLSVWRRLFRAHGMAQSAVLASTQAIIDQAWHDVENPYDPDAWGEFAAVSSAAITRGRERNTDLMGATMRRLMVEADVPFPRVRPVAKADPRGISIEQEMLRPAASWRHDLSRGVPDEQARQTGLTRAHTIADVDLQMASRDAFAAISSMAPQIIGWRRVLHPEIQVPGSHVVPSQLCGLCIAAATRVYHKEELMPIHARCRCTVGPVFDFESEDGDVVHKLNDQDLTDVYASMDETNKNRLKRVKFVVNEHGEIGPVLAEENHSFRDHADATHDARDDTPIGDAAPAAA